MESLADDGVQLTRQGFYERLAADPLHPTTAAPPPGGVMEVMARALDEAEHVIALTAPKELSGIYNTFRLAAEKLGPERVTLVDGRSTSMGLGWQVVVAGEMIEAGAAPDDIEAALLDMQPQIHVWAALDTIHYLRRSGRVGWATAMVGGLFQIKPVIHLYNAVVESVGRVRTAQRGFDLLAELAANPRVVYTRERLLEKVWGYQSGVGGKTVNVHVANLRRKLGEEIGIVAVRGVGYKLEPQDRR